MQAIRSDDNTQADTNHRSYPSNYKQLMSNINPFNSSTRKTDITYMMKVCSMFHYKKETFHKAVSLYDKALYQSSSSATSPSKLKLIALICVDLAAKLEEIETPTLTRYIHCYYYSNSDRILFIKEYYLHLQVNVLNLLSWKLLDATISQLSESIQFQWNQLPINQAIHIGCAYEKDSKIEEDMSSLIDLVIHDEDHSGHLYIHIILSLLLIVVIRGVVLPGAFLRHDNDPWNSNGYQHVFSSVRAMGIQTNTSMEKLWAFDLFCWRDFDINIVQDRKVLFTLDYCLELTGKYFALK